ncbi:beta-lactamase/transpeptidase-like protein [Blyttiomyces helicus]|uniref:Beta-lactamase/transpeptidase-like protein n=1 Tax=Blyttiomyces helicus TaxID=388810 RepID=A0A4P9W6W9_9FUNG|nr:beta-lactamase/transpeptidase-like protein [Blyttiomyces helicus]|eukprot:RKO86728.1 beta-lactamase/transpeptidase-like protein [Blyttiomyces helicus]
MPCESSLDVALTQRLDAEVQEWVSRTFTGSVLVARNNELLLWRGYGLGVREFNVPTTPDMKYRIGSITKQFVAAAALKMQEEGLLNIDSTVDTFKVEGFSDAKGSQITLRQLFNHSSGASLTWGCIPDYVNKEYHATKTIPATNRELFHRFADKPLKFAPGSQWDYSNSNYVLASIIMENILGYPIQDYIQAKILGPLGMVDSGFDKEREIVPNFAHGYSYDKKTDTWHHPPAISRTILGVVAGLHSTVHDLYLWNRGAIVGDFLSEESKDAFFRQQLVRSEDPGDLPELYGMGIAVPTKHNGRTSVAHGSEVEGFRGIAETYAEDEGKLSICILANNDSLKLVPMALRLAAIAFGEDYEIPSEEKKEE